jgi:hypothetical protein
MSGDLQGEIILDWLLSCGRSGNEKAPLSWSSKEAITRLPLHSMHFLLGPAQK